MIFNFRKREKKIADKEAEVERAKKNLHKKVNKDIRSVRKLNAVLDNGWVLKVYEARHG